MAELITFYAVIAVVLTFIRIAYYRTKEEIDDKEFARMILWGSLFIYIAPIYLTYQGLKWVIINAFFKE